MSAAAPLLRAEALHFAAGSHKEHGRGAVQRLVLAETLHGAAPARRRSTRGGRPLAAPVLADGESALEHAVPLLPSYTAHCAGAAATRGKEEREDICTLVFVLYFDSFKGE
jgi:hypothetical protein